MPRSFGVVDLLVARQAHPDAHRGDDLEARVEGVDGDVEADLVVALAGAAVGDRVGALALGDLDEQLRDQRPGERRGQRIGALVERVRLEVRPDEIGDEPLARVDDVGPRRAGRHRARSTPSRSEPPPTIDGQGHDLGVELLPQPGDGDRRVEAARVGEHDLVHRGASWTVRNGACDGFGTRSSQRLEARLVGEQDEERIVARQRAFLLVQASIRRWPGR